MDTCLFRKITGKWNNTNTWLGFVNQLFVLVTTIMKTKYLNKKILMIENFQSDILDIKFVAAETIFDLEKMNNFLKYKYGVTVFSKHDVNIEFISINYGIEDKYIDVKKDILEKCYKNNILYISKSLNLNEIKGDPFFGRVKELKIKYKINEYEFENRYSEKNAYLENEIAFNFINETIFIFDTVKWWFNSFDKNVFNDILRNIHFTKTYTNIAEMFKLENQKFLINKKVNVFHLRIEDDAIKHWSVFNKMTEEEYKKKYKQNTYI